MAERVGANMDLISRILSYVGSARVLAMASTVCSNWRTAALDNVWRLTFDISDFPLDQENRAMIMSEAIMRRSELSELSIHFTDNVGIHEALVRTWLFHTKTTLTSLTLRIRVMGQVDVLRKLAAGEKGVLKHLVWQSTYVPVLNPAIHNLPFLVSLTLDCVPEAISSWKNFQVLLRIFPKLELICLSGMCIEDTPSEFELRASPSLKTLLMKTILFTSSGSLPSFKKVVLHGHNLESLSLINVYSSAYFKGHLAFNIRPISGLKDLVIRSVDLFDCLDLGDNLQHLVIADVRLPRVRIGSLASLQHLKLSITRDLDQDIWSTYSPIIMAASSNLKRLELLGGFSECATHDIEIILSAFPFLKWLALDYQHAFFGEPPKRPRLWERLVDLELHTVVDGINRRLFVRWMANLLQCCPNLRQLTIAFRIGNLLPPEFSQQLRPLLFDLIDRDYGHINVALKRCET